MAATEVIVPLATAALGAVGGYAAAATQARSENRRTTAENNRLREERDARRFEARSEAYEQLVLTSWSLVHWWRSATQRGRASRDELLAELDRRVSKVVVIGTEGVRAAAEALHAENHGGSRPEELGRLHGELVAAIRRDVGAANPQLYQDFI